MNEESTLRDHAHFNRLAAGIKQGDPAAAQELFRHFSPLLYRFFAVRLSDRADSEDLTQDVFFKIVSKIDTFDENKGNFAGWIWQIARNSLIDRYRERKEAAFSDMEEVVELIAVHDQDPDDRMRMRRITDTITGLSEDEQELFALRYLSDLSYKEIAQITGKTESALRVASHRLMGKVRSIIKES